MDVERALTLFERKRLLDAADLLPGSEGKSNDLSRHHKDVESRPVRKVFRPYPNRAILYILIETGMRSEAITKITLQNVNFGDGTITVQGKGLFSLLVSIFHC